MQHRTHLRRASRNMPGAILIGLQLATDAGHRRQRAVIITQRLGYIAVDPAPSHARPGLLVMRSIRVGRRPRRRCDCRVPADLAANPPPPPRL